MAESLDDRYKTLAKKRDVIQSQKQRVEHELASRKRALRESLEACKAAGFDPNTLEEDIRKSSEVLALKMDSFERDLTSAEEVLRPMIQGLE